MAVAAQPLPSAGVDLLITVAVTLSCFGLALGLTYAPCYSAMFVETYFPIQTRGHIGLFYGSLAGLGIALLVRAHLKSIRAFSEWHPRSLEAIVSVTGKRLSAGALLLIIWIAGLSFGSIGYWYPVEHTYWLRRGELEAWTQYMFRVVWTGVTGHWLHIWMGLVVLPVGRDSIVSRAFHIERSTHRFAHKMLAYSLLVGGLIHGLLYYCFLAAWLNEEHSEHGTEKPVHFQFNPDDPVLTWDEAEEKGIYAWFVLSMGALTGLILVPVMVIASLPVLRRINYNAFYFIHITVAILIMVAVSLHASTNFYCLLPRLFLWVGDWGWRHHPLYATVDIQIENAGNGWCRLRLPRHVDNGSIDSEKLQYPQEALQSYYVNIPELSRIQLHPFTVARHDQTGPVLLF